MHYAHTALHIPDSFLTLIVSALCWLLTVALLSVAINRTNHMLGEKQVPLMGVMAAFIFAAQMINFPVAGGTSGHLLGGALAAMVLGPWAAMLVMTAVIAVQALLFQDGGLIVMGANILNMGLITSIVGYGLYRIVAEENKTIRLAAAGLAAWFSVIIAAFATSIELWLSGTAQLQLVMPAMLGVHTLIGIGEALITVSALAFILRTRPDLLDSKATSAGGSRKWIFAGLAIAAGFVLLAPIASSNPDGLNRVAEDLGFINNAITTPANPFISGYSIAALGTTPQSKIIAGIVGILAVFGIITVISRILQRNK